MPASDDWGRGETRLFHYSEVGLACAVLSVREILEVPLQSKQMSAAESWNRIWLSIFIGGSLVIIVVGLIMYRSRVDIGPKGARSLGQWIWWIIVGIIGYFISLLFLRLGV